jgi:hypothetical protein
LFDRALSFIYANLTLVRSSDLLIDAYCERSRVKVTSLMQYCYSPDGKTPKSSSHRHCILLLLLSMDKHVYSESPAK